MSFGYLDVVKVLAAQPSLDVNAIVKVNMLDKYQNTFADTTGAALHVAAFNGHHEIIAFLLTLNNINTNIKDFKGSRPLHYAAETNHPETVRVLVSHFCTDVNAPDETNSTALRYASSFGHVEVVKVLCSHSEIDVNALDNSGNSPIHYAVKNHFTDTVKVLAAHKSIDINIIDTEGKSPLLHCSALGYADIVNILISHRHIDVTLADNRGHIPLFCAAKSGNVSVVNELLETPYYTRHVLGNDTSRRSSEELQKTYSAERETEMFHHGFHEEKCADSGKIVALTRTKTRENNNGENSKPFNYDKSSEEKRQVKTFRSESTGHRKMVPLPSAFAPLKMAREVSDTHDQAQHDDIARNCRQKLTRNDDLTDRKLYESEMKFEQAGRSGGNVGSNKTIGVQRLFFADQLTDGDIFQGKIEVPARLESQSDIDGLILGNGVRMLSENDEKNNIR